MSAGNHSLPARPHLGFLKKLAKERLKKLRETRPQTQLAAAQLAIARDHGFASWRAMKAHVEQLQSKAPAAPSSEMISPRADEFLESALCAMDQDFRTGSLQCAQELLKAEPELGKTNIFTACATGNVSRVQELLKENPDAATKHGGTRSWPPILYLCFSRFLRIKRAWASRFVRCAKLLLDHGADPNSFWMSKDNWRETALYGASGVSNCPPLAQLLLDRGAVLDGDKESLYHSAEFKDNKCLKLILANAPNDSFLSHCMNHKMDIEDPAGLKLFLDHDADPNIEFSLHFAIRRGRSVKIIKMLLVAGANPNLKNREGYTPFNLAGRLGHKAAAQLLKKSGAIDELPEHEEVIASVVSALDTKVARNLIKNKDAFADSLTLEDQKLLPHAASIGNSKAVGLMVALGWNIETPGEWGGTALHQATWHGHIPIVQFLLARGANVDHKQTFGGDVMQTAIHGAAHAGHKNGLAIVKLIAKHMRDRDFEPYMKFAREQKKSPIIQFLAKLTGSKEWSIENLPAHRKSHKIVQWKPIMDAACTGNADRVEKLLKAGVDPNIQSTTPHRYRPLHRAIEFKKTAPRHEGHDRVVKILLKHGADPTLRATHSNVTALQLAAMGEWRFVPLLKDQFEPLDIFHAAALGNTLRVIDLLRFDPSLAKARDANQWTALHYCAASAKYRSRRSPAMSLATIAKFLIRAGADVMASFNFNEEWPLRPLYFACGFSNNPRVTEILLKAGADPCDNESVYHATDEGHDECLALIEKYASPEKLAAECTRCLSTQIHWGHIRGMRWLLEHGADPNALTGRHKTSALHEAAARGLSDDVIKLLLKHGGDPNRKTPEGKTAIDLIKKSAKSRLIKLLR